MLGKMWQVAAAICLIVIALTLSQSTPLPGTLTQRIVTDKAEYHVGDTIRARWMFVNTNSWAVSFSPPGEVSGMRGSYEGDYPSYSTIVHISYTQTSFDIPPGGNFTVLQRDFPVGIVGSFTVSAGSFSKLIRVQP